MLLIRSRNLDKATEFARRHKLKRWRYLSGSRCLIGTKRGESFILVGEWWRHKESNKIDQLIIERDLEQVFASQLNTCDDAMRES